jgi:opacity protein-like surface antigen
MLRAALVCAGRIGHAVLACAALAIGLTGPTSAWAQCTDNFNFFAFVAGKGFTPVQNLAPLGTGSSLSALTSTINTVNTAFLTSTSAFVSAPTNPQPDQQGSGVWARSVAGTVETNSTSTGTLDLSKVAVPFPAATGTQTCNTTTRQDYWGYQVGHDISVLNSSGTGANWHFGVTAGYLAAQTRDITPAGAFFQPAFNGVFNTPAGSFSENSQVPFAGVYTAFTQGNLFVDGQARWDFYQNSLNDPLNGLANQRLDARGFSLTGNVGYHIPLGYGWFIEPALGMVWSRVNVDPLNVAGVTLVDTIARGTVVIDTIESALGRASLSVGTSLTYGSVTWQPYFTASVFHEYAGDVMAKSVVSGTGNPFIDNLSLSSSSTGGVGTYGQFAIGTAALLGNTGWLGYARGDYRIGDHIEGWSVNAGLRYQFTPENRGSIKNGLAIERYNWSGPYIGGYAGSMWGDAHAVTSAAAGPFAGLPVEPDFAGTIGGGQAGFNLQISKTVLGIEVDYGFTNAHGGVSCPGVLGVFYTCEAELHRLATLAGRLGWTWGRALLYAKGGLAVGEVTAGTAFNGTSTLVPVPGGPPGGSMPLDQLIAGGLVLVLPDPLRTTNWQVGWTAGGGMEFALTNRWSAKAEYMHYDLGKDKFTTFFGDPGTDVTTRGDIVRVGVNLHFNSVQTEIPLK